MGFRGNAVLALLASLRALQAQARSVRAASEEHQMQLYVDTVNLKALTSPLLLGNGDRQQLDVEGLGRVCVDTSENGKVTLCSKADESLLDPSDVRVRLCLSDVMFQASFAACVRSLQKCGCSVYSALTHGTRSNPRPQMSSSESFAALDLLSCLNKCTASTRRRYVGCSTAHHTSSQSVVRACMLADAFQPLSFVMEGLLTMLRTTWCIRCTKQCCCALQATVLPNDAQVVRIVGATHDPYTDCVFGNSTPNVSTADDKLSAAAGNNSASSRIAPDSKADRATAPRRRLHAALQPAAHPVLTLRGVAASGAVRHSPQVHVQRQLQSARAPARDATAPNADESAALTASAHAHSSAEPVSASGHRYSVVALRGPKRGGEARNEYLWTLFSPPTSGTVLYVQAGPSWGTVVLLQELGVWAWGQPFEMVWERVVGGWISLDSDAAVCFSNTCVLLALARFDSGTQRAPCSAAALSLHLSSMCCA